MNSYLQVQGCAWNLARKNVPSLNKLSVTGNIGLFITGPAIVEKLLSVGTFRQLRPCPYRQ
jgi:hypothetical protein